MQIGLFDHIEDGGRPLAQLFDERLQFIQAADEALYLAKHMGRDRLCLAS